MNNHFSLFFVLLLLYALAAAIPVINLSLISPQVVPIITNSTVEPNFSSLKAALDTIIFTPDDLQVKY